MVLFTHRALLVILRTTSKIKYNPAPLARPMFPPKRDCAREGGGQSGGTQFAAPAGRAEFPSVEPLNNKVEKPS